MRKITIFKRTLLTFTKIFITDIFKISKDNSFEKFNKLNHFLKNLLTSSLVRVSPTEDSISFNIFSKLSSPSKCPSWLPYWFMKWL